MEPERGCREEGSAQQAGAGPGLPARPALPPGSQMLGCRNRGQPGLPNATTAASLRAGGPRGWGAAPLPRLVSGPGQPELGQGSAPYPC